MTVTFQTVGFPQGGEAEILNSKVKKSTKKISLAALKLSLTVYQWLGKNRLSEAEDFTEFCDFMQDDIVTKVHDTYEICRRLEAYLPDCSVDEELFLSVYKIRKDILQAYNEHKAKKPQSSPVNPH